MAWRKPGLEAAQAIGLNLVGIDALHRGVAPGAVHVGIGGCDAYRQSRVGGILDQVRPGEARFKGGRLSFVLVRRIHQTLGFFPKVFKPGGSHGAGTGF